MKYDYKEDMENMMDELSYIEMTIRCIFCNAEIYLGEIHVCPEKNKSYIMNIDDESRLPIYKK